MAMKVLTRTFATANPATVFRRATARDVDCITQRIIKEGWHVGPYDYRCGFAFDPKGFFVREIDHELVSHVCAIRYPNSHSHLGGSMVSEKYRKRGYYAEDTRKALKFCNAKYTMGGDIIPQLTPIAQREGFTKVWGTYAVSFDLQNIIEKLQNLKCPKDIHTKSLHEVESEKLLEYDRSVFGTDRRVFMKKWISAPGSFGYAAVDGSDKLVGYIILKQAVRGGGTEIGLAIAPFYSDDPHIAKCLLKTAAERCLANEAVPKTKLEMVHPVGDICGEGAPLLMKELEAELIHITDRVYSKGVPSGRQTKKIYGIASPSFD